MLGRREVLLMGLITVKYLFRNVCKVLRSLCEKLEDKFKILPEENRLGAIREKMKY